MNYEQEALTRILKAKEINASELDLTELELSKLPKEIADLKNLSMLNLSKSKISNYDALHDLPHLKHLILKRNEIKKASFFKSLKNLEILDVRNNALLDCPNLIKDLPALRCLVLIANYVENYDFLAELPALNWLSLEHNRIKDYTFLKNIKKLVCLKLGHNQLTDICFLENLENLKYLNLEFNEIEQIESVKALSNLLELDLGHNKVKDISPLENLKEHLTKVNLWKNEFTNYSSLEKLHQLQNLGLWDNNIVNIHFLTNLPQLKKLDLRINPIRDTQPLTKLPNLIELNLGGTHIQDFSFIKYLTQLKQLVLFGNGIKDASFITQLTQLEQLLLSNNSIENIYFLKPLKQLQILFLDSNKINHFSSDVFFELKKLQYINLSYNPIQNIPRKLYYNKEDSRLNVRNYFNDLKKGSHINDTLKVAFIGNARTGKTSLMRVLSGETFNHQEPTTHSIYLKQWQATPSIYLNFWDFGGQHLYHATHRIFLQTEAIFVLLWEMLNNEQQEVYELNPITKKPFAFKNHGQTYWLSYLKSWSKNSSIFLVQSKIDVHNHQKQFPNQYPIWQKNFRLEGSFHVDSQTGRGITHLKEELIYYAQKIINEQPLIPLAWYKVRQVIQSVQKFNNEQRAMGKLTLLKRWNLSHFEALCYSFGLDTASSLTLIEYLHNTGEVFYLSQLFDNQIIVDQEWLIHAIYTLFDREKNFYKLLVKGNGIFSFADLNEHWEKENYTFDEKKHFIRYMEQCEICFERTKFINDFEQKEWIAPYLMPEKPPISVMDLFKEKQDCLFLQMRHDFFYYGIIQSFIIRSRYLSDATEMWRYGIYLSDKQSQALISADEVQNLVTIQVRGMNRKNLLDKIRNEFKKIHETQPNLWVSADGNTYVPLSDVETHQKEMDFTYNGKRYFVQNYSAFLQVNANLEFPSQPQVKSFINPATPFTIMVNNYGNIENQIIQPTIEGGLNIISNG